MMASKIGLGVAAPGAPPRGRASRSHRRAFAAQCAKKDAEQSQMHSGARTAAAAAAAALLLAQGQPAFAAAPALKDAYTRSQEEFLEFSSRLPKLKLPESAPPPKEKAKLEQEFVAPKQVELQERPLKLREPVRSTVIQENPLVPAPNPPKPAPVSNEGVVKIIGGDVPAPPPAPERKPQEAALPRFSFPSLPKAEEPPKPAPAPEAKVEAPPAEPTPAPTPPPTPPQEVPGALSGFFSGGQKAPESGGEAGKPELPQQEPAVTPGATIVVPESKDIAPEPKVAAPEPATKETPAPFSFFGGSKPEEKAPEPEAPPPAAEEKPAAPFSFFGASKSGELSAEDANALTLPLPPPAAAPEEALPKPDDNPFASLFNSSPQAEPKGPPAPVKQPAKAEAKAEGAAPSGGAGSAPVLATVGGVVAIAVAGFSANAKSAADFKAAEEEKKVAEAKAAQEEEKATTTVASKEE